MRSNDCAPCISAAAGTWLTGPFNLNFQHNYYLRITVLQTIRQSSLMQDHVVPRLWIAIIPYGRPKLGPFSVPM